jgi:small subunit ribosomal protein S2
LPSISMKELLEAGVHFGHQTKRWNPKMKEYIFGERNGIYIIDLQKTLKLFKDAMRFVGEMAAQGKNVLFVGTKRQAQEAIAEEAGRCQMYYVNQRWLGGLLTNHITIQRSIKRLKELDSLANDSQYQGRSKKEITRLERERKHLQLNLAGIKEMPGLPDFLFVIDSNKEDIAVREARKLGIPVVAVVDTNCDPDMVDYPIAGNDDALRAIRLFSSKIADAVVEGRALATEQDFAAERIVTDETPLEEIPEYTQYVDPRYAEQLMSESIPDEDLPSMSLPRKGPASETTEDPARAAETAAPQREN